MKRIWPIFSFLIIAVYSNAQTAFRTVVPQKPVVVGESFQVQYIIQDGEEAKQFRAPEFPGFKLVSGPSIYHGTVSTINGIKPLTNTVYTLVPLKPGRFIIHGATAIIDEEIINSNNGVVDVITRDEALRRLYGQPGTVPSDYFLAPGEDPQEKVRKNLFLKVMVDRKSCYVGEPVLATFKLYSRLESHSDIVKNPGFYGFTVYDMVSLSDKQSSQEKINGRLFDVHTIRKVQLYPLQAGDFFIDAMEVRNKIEFSRSVVSRKTEQEIVEGVLGYDEEPLPETGTEIVETEMHTESIMIHVKPIPAVKSKPEDYSGAVGEFSIRSTVLKDKLDRNEEGIFEIAITGKGNFTQLSAPDVKWPPGVEGFEPVVQDVLDKNENPLKGRRVYRYTFVVSSAGKYSIPPVIFSFFRPDSGSFKTIQTAASEISVSNELRKSKGAPVVSLNKKDAEGNDYLGMIVALSLIIISAFVLLSLRRNRHKKESLVTISQQKPMISVEELLKPAHAKLEAPDKEFFSALHRLIWDFLVVELSLSGSELNKNMLLSRLKQLRIPQITIDETLAMISLAESGMFTNADLAPDKAKLLEQTEKILQNIHNA